MSASPAGGRALRGAPWAALATILAGAAAAVYAKTAGLTFFLDEWDLVTLRRGNGPDAFLDPHNEHLIVASILPFKALLETVGMTPYWPYVTLIVLANVACGALLFAIGRSRVGDVPALCAAAAIVFFGPGWEDILLPFQITLVGSLAAGLGALIALERGRDVAASALIALALGFSNAGIPFVIAAAVELALGRDRRRRLVRVLALPLLLYAVWYLAYGESDLQWKNAYETLPFAAKLLSNSLAGGLALPAEFGPPVLLALGAATAYVLTRPGVPARTWAVFVLAVSYPVLTALARADSVEPHAPRYLYPTLLLVLVLLFELVRGRRMRPAAAVLLAALTAGVVVTNFNAIRTEPKIKIHSSFLRPKLTVVELARGRVAPDFQIDPGRTPQLRAGPYLAAVEDYGSAADTIAEVLDRPLPERAEADETLLAALRFAVAPAASPPRGADCLQVERRGARASLDVNERAPRHVVHSPARQRVEIRVRRFAADRPQRPAGAVAAGRAGTVALPADEAVVPWRVTLSSSAAFRVCPPA